MEVRAVFLDRDGTIIEDVNYLNKIEDIKLLPYAKEGLTLLKNNGFKLVVVTNQSGIGRGYFSEEFVNKSHTIIDSMLGNIIDKFYFCPHTPYDNCLCRKPKTGMIDEAVKDLKIDITKSFVIGDKESDIELGLNAGITPILVETGYGKDVKNKTKAAKVFNNLYEVAKWICRKDFTE